MDILKSECCFVMVLKCDIKQHSLIIQTGHANFTLIKSLIMKKDGKLSPTIGS